jgi:antitoxin ParD1/3/4
VTDREQDPRLAALDTAIRRGLADVKEGRTRPAEEVFDRLEAKYRTMSESRGS